MLQPAVGEELLVQFIACLLQDRASLSGQFQEPGSPIGGMGHPPDQARGFQPVHGAGQGGGMNLQALAGVAHWQRSARGEPQQGEHLEAREGQPMRLEDRVGTLQEDRGGAHHGGNRRHGVGLLAPPM